MTAKPAVEEKPEQQDEKNQANTAEPVGAIVPAWLRAAVVAAETAEEKQHEQNDDDEHEHGSGNLWTGLDAESTMATTPQFDRWNNHWAEICKNCRHQKRNHARTYEVGVRGKLVSLGACMDVNCDCRGYTDGRYWLNGSRINALIR